MKRIIITLVLPAVMCAAAYGQALLKVNESVHDFGDVLWNNPVTAEFRITNGGSSPLVISNVTVSCACAAIDWTQTPIPAGQTGMVKAVFDAKALGYFNKSIGIYSNASPAPTYLTFKGRVATEVDNSERFFPYTIDKIGLDKHTIEFPDAHWGDIIESEMNVINHSDAIYEPVLMHLPKYVTAQSEPRTIAKKQMAKIKLTLDTRLLKEMGLTQTSVYLARFPGDVVTEETELPLNVVLLPDFSHLTDFQRANPPRMQLSESTVNLGSFGKKEKLTHTLLITNTGKSPLQIEKLQVFNSSVNALLSKRHIKPGASTKLKITLHKKDFEKLKEVPRVLMITNDPDTPKMIISLNASID